LTKVGAGLVLVALVIAGCGDSETAKQDQATESIRKCLNNGNGFGARNRWALQ